MISSKACRCSRSRRRSSAAMCRFQGGKPAARSPAAISAARRERAAGARAARAAALEGWPRGRGGGPERREVRVRPAAGRARRQGAPSQSRGSAGGASRSRRPTPAIALQPRSVRGPRPSAAHRNSDSSCPATARRRPPPSGAARPTTLVPRRVEPRRGRTATARSTSSTDGRAGGHPLEQRRGPRAAPSCAPLPEARPVAAAILRAANYVIQPAPPF